VDSVAFAMAFVLLAVAGLALAFAVAERRRMRAGSRTLGQLVSLDVALVASVAAILVLTLFPIEDATDVQLVPLGDISDALTPPVEAERLLIETANVLLFVPVGVVLGLRGLRLGATAAVGLALSAGVELTQLLLVSGRTTSVDDLLLNTLGVVLGYAFLSRVLLTRHASAPS
jgi:glycopeptide antibiotics resistance protein